MEAVKILVIEQESELRATLRHGLQLNGYLVAEAADGRAALEIMRQEPPHLVLLDLMVPAVGSIALLAEMRARPGTGYRVIVLADGKAVEAAIDALRLGASDFLEKPITLDEAKASVASVLNDAAPQAEWRDEHSEGVLEIVRSALRAGTFAAAEAAMVKPSPSGGAATLNLAGVVYECHGRMRGAREFYQRAAAVSPAYWPAQENLRRLSEINTRGQSQRAVALGEMRSSPAARSPVLPPLDGVWRAEPSRYAARN